MRINKVNPGTIRETARRLARAIKLAKLRKSNKGVYTKHKKIVKKAKNDQKYEQTI